jgi:hypothetical protein
LAIFSKLFGGKRQRSEQSAAVSGEGAAVDVCSSAERRSRSTHIHFRERAPCLTFRDLLETGREKRKLTGSASQAVTRQLL